MKSTILIAAAALMLASAATAEVAPTDLLPTEKEMEGWNKDGEVLTYVPEDLWEYINGQAETFLMYEFIRVAGQHYLDADELEIKAEIYEHGDPLMAFGIYSQFRSPDGTYYDGLGNEAFGDEYSIHFWKGKYYAKVSAYDEGEKSAKAMMAFASLMAEKIPEEGGEPKEVSLFPADGLVEKSITYVTEGVMGTGKLPPAFVGDYISGEEKGKLYIFRLGSGESAKEVFDWYAGELGAEVSEEKGYTLALGEAPYRGPVKLFRTGSFMGILTGFGADSGIASALVDSTVKLMEGFCKK